MGIRVGAATLNGAFVSIMGPEAAGASAQTLAEIGEELVGFVESRAQQRVAQTLKSTSEAAVESSEEQKCKLIANFYASVALDPSVSVDDALLYLRRIRAASWRQLVALRYFESEKRNAQREVIAVEGFEGAVVLHLALGIELSELAGRGLGFVGIDKGDDGVVDPAIAFGGGTITGRSALGIRATELGEIVSRLGRLAEIVSTKELDEIARDLARSRW